MSGNLSAEIVTTGTEILLGEIVDTNAAWMAQQLREAGVNLYYKTTVGDNEARVRGVIELGLSRSDVIIVSGGLGPTVDDITRQAIANATNCPLELHAGALQTLQERFARFGVTMTDNNRQQAYIPHGAIIIENPVGTAPGFIVETAQGGAVIALPGVPREMKHLMTETVLPYLRGRLGQAAIIRRRVLHTIGIGESSIDHQIGDLMTATNPSVGLAAHTAQVDIRITARAANAEEAEALIDQMEATVRQRVGPYIFSTVANETIEMVVARGLQAHDMSIALLESNTAGQIAQRLSSALTDHNPVAAAWTWDSDALPAALTQLEAAEPFSADGVDILAERGRTLGKATLGIAVMGSSGDDEGVYGQRSGETWIAIADQNQVVTHRYGFGGRDEYSQVRLGNQVLMLLWRMFEAA
ncbi:MAG: CinA family nicotinamide mononucleotide deamidase-related protein [Caldilineaceae bacterium]